MKTSKLMKTIAGTLLVGLTLAGCEQPPPESVQRGYRGTGMEQLANPDTLTDLVAANQVPAASPALPATGPKASEVYENVQVLGDLSVGEFTRLMAAITEWVAPEQGCGYCHEGANFADDSVYTKRVARVMLQMTQATNQQWTDHVGSTGVTCYTCHRGKNVPENVWALDPGQAHAPGVYTAMQNIASEAAVYTSLPYDPFSPYLEDDESIRVAGDTALPTDNASSIKQTEWIYSLMMHFSDSLGVNCTHCHNSRAFANWEQSSPARVQAWHGIQMVRSLNNDYVTPTTDWLPAHRKGPQGDAPKVNCATCHQGAYKPLLGVSMVADYPSLSRNTVAAAPVEETEAPADDSAGTAATEEAETASE